MNKIFSILFVFISVVSFGQRPQELQGWGIKPNRLYQNPANVSNQTDTVNYKVALFNTATGKYDKVAWAYLSSLFTGSTHIAWDSVTSKPNSGSFIYNQNASAQSSSNLWVDGRVRGASMWTESYLWAQRDDPY